MPATPQYSSVRRGSNMRRKLTLLLDPPVARMTALRARMFSVLAVIVHGDAEDASRIGLLAIERHHTVIEQDLDAGLFRRRLERTDEAVARRHGRLHLGVGRAAGLHHRPVHHRGVVLARHRIADRAAAQRVRRLVDEDDAVRHQPFEDIGAVVGEGADDLAVVVAIVGKAVGLDHRPIGQVAEQEVGRILDAVFFLPAGAAAERDIAAAAGPVATGMGLGLDQDDRRASLARDDRGGKSRSARADHHDVRLALPFGGRPLRLGERRLRRCERGGGQGRRHAAAAQQQLSPVHRHGIRSPPIQRAIIGKNSRRNNGAVSQVGACR